MWLPHLKAIKQFLRFAVAGTISATLYLGILNALMLVTGVVSGVYFSVFITVAFLASITNSYFLNKFWTFGSRTSVTAREYSRFGAFTVVGALINVSIASFVVNTIGPQWGILAGVWANVGAIVAIAFSMVWNFLAYRYVVFK